MKIKKKFIIEIKTTNEWALTSGNLLVCILKGLAEKHQLFLSEMSAIEVKEEMGKEKRGNDKGKSKTGSNRSTES